MDPQLAKLEALAEPGCYSLTFALDSGAERAVVARFRGDELNIPASAFTGWSTQSQSYQAVAEAVRAVHRARELARPTGVRLLDIDGGWDVSLGNIVLEGGQPACVSHGPLEPDGAAFRCPECGAAAVFG
ncbi:MAG TPA: hypothetical protein VHO01_03125 [Jatrophihabitans sp.]|nr:hypothetical protein [Jatrophihabitans sp.]